MKIKDVKGLLIKKSLMPHQEGYDPNHSFQNDFVQSGFNQAINLQGEKEISLNRDRLARLIWNKQDQVVEFHRHLMIGQCEKIADEIIKHESELFEAREG